MQKGMILFVRQGEEAVPILSAEELIETSRFLGVTAIRAFPDCIGRGILPGAHSSGRIHLQGPTRGAAWAERQQQIFEPFFATKEGMGIGLGLVTMQGDRETAG